MRIDRKSLLSAFTTTEKKKWLVLMLVFLGVWSLYIRYSWTSAYQAVSENALTIARTAETIFPKNVIESLKTPSPKDIETPQYKQINSSLQSLVSINPDIRSAYIYVLKNGKLYFMANSEPVDSKDNLLPGQEYTEATKVYWTPFEDGKSVITHPATDRRGTWISVLIPIKGVETGKIIAVFGTDYLAKTWRNAALYYTVQAGTVILIMFLLIGVLFLILIKHKVVTRSEEKFAKAFNSTAVLMAITTLKDWCYLDVNQTFLETLGFYKEEVIGKTPSDLNIYFDKERSTIDEAFQSEGRVHDFEVSLKGRDGSVYTGICSAELITIGDTPCLLKSLTDITKRKEIEEELTKSEEKYKLLFSAMNDAFSHQSIICDEHGKVIDYRFITINPSFETMMGLKAEDIIGKTATEVLPSVDQSRLEIYERVVLTGESVHFNTFSQRLNKYFEVKAYRPSSKEFATIFMDITERLECEKDIHYLNYHDVLTGLYNRRFYEEEIRRLNTERNLPISLIFGDVNGLKLINDAFGHLKGDELLQKAALAIQSVCRADDIVARWGGDEFVMLLPKTKAEEAEEIVWRIRETYSKEYVNSISGSISFGWDTKCSMEEDILKTLKNAEDLMYKNKTLESEKIRLSTIRTLMETLHEKYPGSEQHSKRVSKLCQDIGRAIGLSEMEVCGVRSAGFFHDIGYVSIEEGILNKPGKLLKQEWDEIKRHAEIGCRILSSSHEMSELADYVLAHHERWDGTGYPRGLQGELIPIEARIIALASSFVAMTSERPYRSAVQDELALQEIIKNAGTQFDPEIAKVFVEQFNNIWLGIKEARPT
ncbi:MAG: diguanylate cyclase [Desulfosporosinus sp.]|nr:diguanylate cyclase [Desulfosporosinus sp.]